MNEAANIRAKKIKEYREQNNIQEFSTPEEYYQWLATPEGKKYTEAIENIRDEVKGRGGRRLNAGRKKLYGDRIALNKRVPSDAVVIIKDFSKSRHISENEAITELIRAGYQALEKKQSIG
ncbi:MAG: hypothetical protein PHC64_01915 [Candidatus Gastranaerophilales bacterium]|nr:hypothetical protein [Candidatus Gastranaerophilales bacterium]